MRLAQAGLSSGPGTWPGATFLASISSYSQWVLVIGGLYSASKKVELLDLKNQSSKTLRDLPHNACFPTGGLLMGQPVVFGGLTNSKCFKLCSQVQEMLS